MTLSICHDSADARSLPLHQVRQLMKMQVPTDRLVLQLKRAGTRYATELRFDQTPNLAHSLSDCMPGTHEYAHDIALHAMPLPRPSLSLSAVGGETMIRQDVMRVPVSRIVTVSPTSGPMQDLRGNTESVQVWQHEAHLSQSYCMASQPVVSIGMLLKRPSHDRDLVLVAAIQPGGLADQCGKLKVSEETCVCVSSVYSNYVILYYVHIYTIYICMYIHIYI